MKYRIYTTSHKAWEGMFRAMASASSSIYLELYIFLDDTQSTHDFLGLLKEKALSGVSVVMIVDSYGSSDFKAAAVSELRACGVEVLFFSRWLRHTHRKILIVDNKIAFVGGVNIKEKTRYWRDLQIMMRGRIIRPVLKSFAYAYKMAGGKKEEIIQHSRLPLAQKLKSWFVDNFSATNKQYQINHYYRDKIINAKSSIIIATPYLLPPRWLIALLDQAVRRGVMVEIIIPRDTDVASLNRINYLNACRLSSLGVRLYLIPVMNHAKAMLVDGEEGVIGSHNLDVLSFNLNMESGVFFRQKDLVLSLRKILEHWRGESAPFEASSHRLGIYDRLLMGVLKIFYLIF